MLYFISYSSLLLTFLAPAFAPSCFVPSIPMSHILLLLSQLHILSASACAADLVDRIVPSSSDFALLHLFFLAVLASVPLFLFFALCSCPVVLPFFLPCATTGPCRSGGACVTGGVCYVLSLLSYTLFPISLFLFWLSVSFFSLFFLPPYGSFGRPFLGNSRTSRFSPRGSRSGQALTLRGQALTLLLISILI